MGASLGADWHHVEAEGDQTGGARGMSGVADQTSPTDQGESLAKEPAVPLRPGSRI